MVTPWAMTPTMSTTSIQEYLQLQRGRYGRRPGKGARSVLLDECEEVSGLDRKHLIKVLGGKRPVGGEGGAEGGGRGRPARYAGILPVIKSMWLASEQPCGKRLRGVIGEWLPCWEKEHHVLGAGDRFLLRNVSAAQLDRLLAPYRAISPRRRMRGSEAGSLRAQVPLRTGPWNVSGPGWMEADSVAHCGGSMSGNFWWTAVMTDIHSGWTEQQPAWNKGQHATCVAVGEMEKQLPFPVRGADTDNGSEFLNYHLLAHWSGRSPAVELTRSRPYRKNDNAHVEQKNRTHVRELLGEERLDAPDLGPLLCALHRHWSDLHNFFLPTLKLTGKERRGTKMCKTYEPVARTPARRLLENGQLEGPQRIGLLARRSALNPFRLREEVERLLREIWKKQHEHAHGPVPDAEEFCGSGSGTGGSLEAPTAASTGPAKLLRAC